MRAENKNLWAQKTRGVPSHPGILGEAKEIAGGLSKKHLGRDREKARWTRSMRGDCRKSEVGSFEYGRERDFLNGSCS